jgi:FkbM family methyltransferase
MCTAPANFPAGDVRVAVDAGCYIGFKAMAYADRMGPDGKVIAVEMMPDNYELLRRNVDANGFTEKIATVNCGLSDVPGTMVARRSQRQAATIADVDQLAGFADERLVELDTLANVFDRMTPARWSTS